MKKCAFLFFSVLSAAALFCADPKITVKVASVAPNRSPWDVEQRKLGQAWSKVTDGLINVQFFDAAALGGEGAVIQKLRAVRPGQKPPLDGAIFTSIGVYSLAPATNILTLCTPFLFRNQKEVDYIFDRFSDEMAASFNKRGYIILGWFPVGWIYFSTKERVDTPAQLKKVRLAMGGVGSAELTAAFKVAGFNVDNIPNDKIAQSLKTPGGVQGVYAIPMYTYATKMHDTLKYTLDLPICPVISAFFVSDEAWASIPDGYKAALMAELRKTETNFLAVSKNSDAQYLKLIEDGGGVLTKLTGAQTAEWEETLRADAFRMARSDNSVINLDFLERITLALDEYRKR